MHFFFSVKNVNYFQEYSSHHKNYVFIIFFYVTSSDKTNVLENSNNIMCILARGRVLPVNNSKWKKKYSVELT